MLFRSIVAEGIEDPATLELLSGLGCDLGQGYYISVPKPASLLKLAPADSAKPPLPRLAASTETVALSLRKGPLRLVRGPLRPDHQRPSCPPPWPASH